MQEKNKNLILFRNIRVPTPWPMTYSSPSSKNPTKFLLLEKF